MPEEEVRLGVMADGARGIWKPAQARFPSAVELLDSDHCGAHLHKVAVRPYGAQPERQQPWSEAALARLLEGEVPGVIWGRQRMTPTDAQAAEEINKLVRYLQRPEERLDDRWARQGGYPLGSGGIESATQVIGQVRRKRSGAWWYVTNANHMLALRGATYQGTFDRLCERSRRKIPEESAQTPPNK